MQFKIGDRVMHASQGNGQILAIEEKQFSGNQAQLFYAVAIDKGTVWVPVEVGNSSRLRLMVSDSALENCRVLLKGRPGQLNANYRQRSMDLAKRVQQGSFEIMCEVVRDLTAHSWPKPLSESDSSTLHKARDAVCFEWANAAGVSLVDALHEVTGLLKEGQQAYSIQAA
jgi:RNA polymerase-interacting CarD/CdnL/TRCF family regulator